MLGRSNHPVGLQQIIWHLPTTYFVPGTALLFAHINLYRFTITKNLEDAIKIPFCRWQNWGSKRPNGKCKPKVGMRVCSSFRDPRVPFSTAVHPQPFEGCTTGLSYAVNRPGKGPLCWCVIKGKQDNQSQDRGRAVLALMHSSIHTALETFQCSSGCSNYSADCKIKDPV